MTEGDLIIHSTLYPNCCRFPQALGVCLTQIISVSNILQEVQTLRVEKYSESNPQHEKQLLEASLHVTT